MSDVTKPAGIMLTREDDYKISTQLNLRFNSINECGLTIWQVTLWHYDPFYLFVYVFIITYNIFNYFKVFVNNH